MQELERFPESAEARLHGTASLFFLRDPPPTPPHPLAVYCEWRDSGLNINTKCYQMCRIFASFSILDESLKGIIVPVSMCSVTIKSLTNVPCHLVLGGTEFKIFFLVFAKCNYSGLNSWRKRFLGERNKSDHIFIFLKEK